MSNVRSFLAVLACALVSQIAMGQASMNIQIGKPEELVVGLPFSADQKVSNVQHLSNGIPLKAEIDGHIYRSAAGVERYEGTTPPGTDHPEPVTLAFIIDRAKHTAVLLNFKSKTATVDHLPPNATVTVKFLALQQSRNPNQSLKPGDVVMTDLGKRTQGLMTLVGKRATGTIPAGRVGNDQPLLATTDVWVDPQLKVTVNEVERNPFSGERTFELSNIRGEEPDPALFEIPEGFTVKTRAPMPGMLPASTPTAEQREKQIPLALSGTDPIFKNSVAYALASNNSHLAEAQTLAEDAVRLMEQETAAVAVKGNKDEIYRQSIILTSYWDTLGWVYYRQGKQAKAEAYVLAAWNLKPNREYALHLGSIYEAESRPKEAVAIYRMALNPKNPTIWQDDFENRLAKLGDDHAEAVPMEITTSLPSSVPSPGTGARGTDPIVEVLIAAATLPVVTYLSGEPAQKEALTQAIQSALVHSLPDSGPETVLRRARVTCAAGQGVSCVLHFLTPGREKASVASVSDPLKQ